MAQTAKRERAHYRGFGPVLSARADRKVDRIQAELDDLVEHQKIDIQYQENIERLRSYVARTTFRPRLALSLQWLRLHRLLRRLRRQPFDD
jgi:hypothetical protein